MCLLFWTVFSVSDVAHWPLVLYFVREYFTHIETSGEGDMQYIRRYHLSKVAIIFNSMQIKEYPPLNAYNFIKWWKYNPRMNKCKISANTYKTTKMNFQKKIFTAINVGGHSHVKKLVLLK